MSITHPTGLSRQVNRAVLTATLAFCLVAFAALAALALTSFLQGSTTARLVYGLSLVACALASFVYNMRETSERRALLRYLDHAAIFLLIAGTYTPFAAAGIRGPFYGSLLTWVWVLALAGIIVKLVLPRAHDRACTGLYLALGWLFIVVGDEVVRSIPQLPLLLLGLGGGFYTVGAVIYARDIGRWTDPVWHSCVLGGIVAHFAAVIAFGASWTAA